MEWERGGRGKEREGEGKEREGKGEGGRGREREGTHMTVVASRCPPLPPLYSKVCHVI